LWGLDGDGGCLTAAELLSIEACNLTVSGAPLECALGDGVLLDEEWK